VRLSLNWLLIFLPLALWAEHFRPGAHVFIFAAACLAIIPLAAILGRATECIAARAGDALGGFLNATFGNAAELIIAIVALRAGQVDVVKASLTGSIIGNLLLVLGGSFLAGGLRYHMQEFNPIGAGSQAAALIIASIALLVPAAFQNLVGGLASATVEYNLSVTIAIVLLLLYGLSLLFSLHTHRSLFTREAATGEREKEREEMPTWTVRTSLLYLVGASALIAWMSELLVGSVEQAAQSLGMSKLFVGIIIVAIVGNAAEHSTAILMAMKNRMDLSLGIALGSSIQIAIFVAPLLVLLSYAIASEPMDLIFTPGEILAVVLATFIVSHVLGDGRSTWFKGAQLLAVYGIIALAFYFLPV
jgi:Ca2+:H+ antiporter